MAEVYRKKILYETEIRRNYRQQKFKKLRHDASVGMQVNSAWLCFLREQPDQVPQICLHNLKYIPQEHLWSFLQLVMNNELQLLKPAKNINCWYWNCVAINNLKFMTEICKQKTQHLLAGFFNSTFQAYQSYYDFYLDVQKKVKYSGCYLSLLSQEELSEGEINQRSILQYLESTEGSKAILALLEFWGAYLIGTQQPIQVSNFTMMLKLFILFSQYSKIYYDRQAFKFIMAIFTYFQKMQIFNSQAQKSINMQWIVMDCSQFLNRFTKKMPAIIKKHIQYGIYYSQIAQILLAIEKFNKYKPGIFFQLIFQVESHCYVVGLLKKPKQDTDYNQCMINALKLVNHFSFNQNFYQVFCLEGAIIITKILAHTLLLQPTLQRVTAIVLYNIVTEDRNDYFLKIFELVDYQGLLSIVIEGAEIDIYEFLVKVLQIYTENRIIYDKLLVQCDFQVKMRQFYQNKEEKKGYQLFVRLVMRNLEYFMRNYRKVVEEMWHNAKEMTFQGQDAFITKIEQFEHMRLSQLTL